MNNPNPYRQPGPNPGPNPGNQNPYPQQQPQGQFGQPNQFAQQGPQGPKGQSLQWNQISAIVAGVAALLVVLFSSFSWVAMEITYNENKGKVGLNGWGRVSADVIQGTAGDPGKLESEVGKSGLGLFFTILVVGLLIAAAVMLWLKVQPRVAAFLGIGAGALHLIWAVWNIVDFNGELKEAKDALEKQKALYGNLGSSAQMDLNVDGGPQFWVFLTILLALAIIAAGVLVIVKFGNQMNGPAQPNQFGQPGQPNQFGQPGQPNQFGQPGQPGQFGQSGQPGQPNQYGQPGQ